MTPPQINSDSSEGAKRPSFGRVDVPPHDATLAFTSEGRGGTVRYRDHRTAFDMWWEFALPPAVVIIGVASGDTWERDTGIPLSERDRTLAWIADRALRDQVSSGGSVLISDTHITLYRAP
jgi:hypothetical protein